MLALTLAGCASNAVAPLPTPSPTDSIGPNNTMPNGTMTPPDTLMPSASLAPNSSTVPDNSTIMSAEEANVAAKRISDEVAKLSEVDKATTVVMGNTALIGVNFAAQYKGEMTNRIKEMVTERTQKSVPAIKTVVVTADPDLISRIQAMTTKVQNGSSVADVGSEFTEIVNRILPK